MTDISYLIGTDKFNFRVGAIIIDNGRLLMAKDEKENHYYSVGGRVQMGESTFEAVERESFEETGLRFQVDRLAFVQENFFKLKDEHFHEIGFYYLMKSRTDIEKIPASFKEGEQIETLHWLPIDKLKDYKLFPTFFKTELADIGYEIKHFIDREN
jgi:8-oxo-dGTP pyrophosphatase MutT (NUDIX family)